MAILNFQKPDKIILHKANDFEAEFEFRPLEPGYGVTIGNALRRVLLSSLEGYAITGIRITGVDHEFATIKGVIEDVTEIILNLKQVRIKPIIGEDDEEVVEHEKVELVIKNSETFTAADIAEACTNFEIVNQDLVICNMDTSAEIEIEIHIGKGRGYVPSEENRPADAPVNFLPIDAIFTPIKNVKYNIENTRVEQRTDYEKLIMEIKTDGTIHPEEAVKEASRIIIHHLMIITDENITLDDKSDEQEDVVDEGLLQLRKVLNTSLEDLELSVRAFNCLKAAKINNLGELVQYTQDELMKFRNFGQKSLSEIEQLLEERNLQFGMDVGHIINSDNN